MQLRSPGYIVMPRKIGKELTRVQTVYQNNIGSRQVAGL
jgi:hypothetical protein